MRAKVRDIICYHNLQVNELFFHKVIKVNKASYTVKCINDGYREQEGIFDETNKYKIINSKLVKLLFE